MYEHLPEKIVDVLELQLCQQGEYLCRQDENLEYFFLLLTGKLQVNSFQVDGSQAVFSFETPFSIIGDLELFDDNQIVSNVQAVDDSLVFVASAKTIRDYGYNDARFLRFIIRYLVKKLYFSSKLLSQVPLSVEYRVAQYLLHRLEKDGNVLKLEKRSPLAAMLGTSARHLNRTFKRLTTLRAIEVHNKTLIITDPQTLLTITRKGT